MQMRTMPFIILALAVVVALAAIAMPVASRDTTSMSDMEASDRSADMSAGVTSADMGPGDMPGDMPKGDMSALAAMAMPKAVMMTVKVESMDGGNLTVSMPDAARVQPLGGNDIAIVAAYNEPLTKTVNISTGTGLITLEDALPATATIDYANRSSIPVAGANALVVLKQFKMAGAMKEKDKFKFQVGSITVYLPDGTAQTIKPDRPVQISVSLDRMTASVKASPALARTAAGLLSTGATFPADAAPIRINDILAAT